MLALLKRLRKRNEGAAALEFAIVGTVFTFLLIGGIEFGMMMGTQSILDGAVAHASRFQKARAGIDPSVDSVANFRNRIHSYGSPFLKKSRLKVHIRNTSWGNATDAAVGGEGITGAQVQEGRVLQYRARYDYFFFSPMIRAVFTGGKVVLKGSAMVQNEPDV